MAVLQVPKCSFLMMVEDPAKISEPENVPTMERSVPADLHPLQVRFIEDIAKDYIFHSAQESKDPPSPLTARVSLSIERGLEFENCSHAGFQEKMTVQFQQALPLPREKVRGLDTVHKIQPTEEMIRQLPDHMNQDDLEYLDVVSISLLKQGVTHPVTVDLEVRGFVPANKGKGLTTGHLRFPHMLLAMRERLLSGAHPAAPTVCIVGPGLFE
ncbi:MAG: hypothetical protein KFB93_00235 [Simkaniaceae bacterium]|nr:MAG: hypothetical protein KFB93_00235 [Simkaniaceae bacterium]